MRTWGLPFRSSLFTLTCAVALGGACREDAPSDDDGAVTSGTGGDAESDGGSTAVFACGEGEVAAADRSACEPLASDYTPRANASADDPYPACISDDGDYHLVEDVPSSAGRVAAFVAMGDLLWRDGVVPSAEDFQMARVLYGEAEGLESRVVRREDLHANPVPMEDWVEGVEPDKQCTDPSNVEKYPDRCVGPAVIAPMITAALDAGVAGEGDPRVHAATVEAAGLWFLQISTYKECFTCTFKAKDCDSCWAYYTGGNERGAGVGLAAEVAAVEPETDERAFDGVTAVRCWRDLYPVETYTALDDVPEEGQTMFANAWEQLDVALFHGLAVVLRARVAALLEDCESEAAAAHWAFIRVIARALDAELERRSGIAATTIRDAVAQDDPSSDTVVAIADALDTVFDCP